jgi:hypothetical protein
MAPASSRNYFAIDVSLETLIFDVKQMVKLTSNLALSSQVIGKSDESESGIK